MKTEKALLLVLIVSLMGLWSQPAESDTGLPAGKVVFKIGQEDKSNREFKRTGFKGVREFNCTAGIDCTVEAFPKRLYRMSAVQSLLLSYPDTDDSGVVRITINFTLDQDYKEVVLRLARAGDETTVVTVDGKRTHLVTNSMLGSGDGYVAGVYNLMLGSLKMDTHTIQLTVEDDGKGNGCHSWDGLTLFAELLSRHPNNLQEKQNCIITGYARKKSLHLTYIVRYNVQKTS